MDTSDRMEVIGSNLKIRDAKIWDEGLYACKAESGTGEEKTLKVYLSVACNFIYPFIHFLGE